jgi:hypothetical protein
MFFFVGTVGIQMQLKIPVARGQASAYHALEFILIIHFKILWDMPNPTIAKEGFAFRSCEEEP